MIQHKKAEYFGDTDITMRILQCTKGYECKRLSKEIHGFDTTEWENQAKILCSDGLYEKYKQNPQLKDYLLPPVTRTSLRLVMTPYGAQEYLLRMKQP